MTTAPHQDTWIIDVAGRELAALAASAGSLVSASLLSDDGFEITRTTSGPDIDGNRFASMSSSIQALSEAVVRELTMGTSEYVIIAADRGHLVQMRVPGQTIVLAALFGTDEMLGKALTLSRRAAQSIGQALASRAATPEPAFP